MSLYKTFATDKELETNKGIDLDYGEGGIITIRRAGGYNRKYSTVAEAKYAPYRRQIQAGTIGEEVASKLLAEIYAESVVTGWKGVKDEHGDELEFTKENVVKLFTDLPDFFKEVRDQAERIANFRRESEEEDAKNSVKSSSGNGKTRQR